MTKGLAGVVSLDHFFRLLVIMKVLLVNPFYPISENPSPPLGLAFLAAAVRKAGHEACLLDLVVFPTRSELLAEMLEDFRPDIVGATAVTMSFNAAADVMTKIKRLAPQAVTVIGGPHVTFHARETLEAVPSIDFVVMGEGEAAICELAEAVARGGGYEDIAGLAFRRDGEVVFTSDRPPGLDVNQLPTPARDILPLGRYKALGLAISVTTSRGCPFGCIFCVGRKMVGAKVRYRDPVAVVDELEAVASWGFHQINLADDLFTANKKHCLAVCDEIIRRGLNFKWTSFARVDTVSLEVLERMKEAGCTAVSFGVETGNPEIMKTIRKGITLEQVVAAVEMCTKAGVLPHASFILGLPGETPETLAETVAFGEKLKTLGVSHGFHLLAPFPGTLVREKHEEYGLKILTNDWPEYHANRAIVETDTVSAAMMDGIVAEWQKAFDDYLGDLKRRLESGEATAEEAWPLINLERCVLTYDLMMDRFLEEHGCWSDDGSDPLEILAAKVSDHSGKTRDLAIDTLRAALDKGSLRLFRQNGLVRWEWVDYL